MFNSSLRVRIPPSPTGPLHLGTARTALYNLLVAKRFNGKFVFRLEDTDRERSKSEYVSDIINGFKWLGITWDEGPLRQSEHKARHAMVVKELIEKNLAYECFCTPDELDQIKASQRAMNQVEGYDNRHRSLTEEQKQEFRAAGRKPIIRFRLPDKKEIAWKDLIRGEMRVNTSDLGGDPVIAKENGDILYNFAVVIDDHDANITHIIRGEDHLHNTAKQIPLYLALEWPVPDFAHVPLILTANREKLSKRKHGDIASISKYIHEGYLPEAIVNYLIAMSWQFSADKEIFDFDEAVSVFDLANISKSPAVYDPQKLHWFCKEHFKRLSAEEVLKRAKNFLDREGVFLVEYSTEEQLQMVSLIKDGLITLSEIPTLLKPFCILPEFEYLEPTAKACLEEPEAKKILITLAEILEYLSEINIQKTQEILAVLSEKLGIKKGKKLFWPIRVAISGNVHGPELTSIFAIMGINRLKERVKKALEFIG